MLIGMSVEINQPDKSKLNGLAVIVSEASMTNDGDWYVLVTAQGKIVSVDTYHLTII